MQVLQQTSQRKLLSLRPCVAGSLAVGGKASYVCHSDGMGVVVLAVGTDFLFGAPRLDGAIRWNDIVVAAAAPSEQAMIAVDVRHPQRTARPVGGAMHDNKSNLSHKYLFFKF